MAQYLDKAGLTTLWTKIKNTFALKKHTHKKSEITDLTIPTVNNPTITINQGGVKKGSFSLNQSGAATIDLTDDNTTYSAATQSANGLMSSSDKKKLDGIAEGANKITIDSSLSSTSTNPVQNKVINSALDNKQPKGNYVTTDTAQEITGDKTFSTIRTNANVIVEDANNNSSTYYQNKKIHYGEQNSDGDYIADYTYTLPDKSGVLATTDDLIKITVDSSLSSTSTNPVQNKVIKSALDGKANSSHDHDSRYYTESEIDDKLGKKANISHSHSSLTNSSGRVFNVPTGGSGGEQKTLVITDDLNNYQPAGNYASSTHKHPISDINNLQSTIDGIYTDIGLQDEAIAGKADVGHTHEISNINGLQSALNGKSNLDHNHDSVYQAKGDYATNDTLKSYVTGTTFIDYTTYIEGEVNKKANASHSHDISNITGLQSALDGKSNTGHGHAISDITNLQSTLNGKLNDYGSDTSRPNGTTFTFPGGSNPVQMRSGNKSAGQDIGIFSLTDDNAFICNSSDNGYAFAVFDTDKTADFSSASNAAFAVLSDHSGVSIKGGLSVDGKAVSLDGHTHSYLPLAGGTLTGTLGFKSNYLVKPVAEFRTQDNTFTGAITIALPAGISNTMVSMWIDVYNYVTNTSFSVHVGGYTYENQTWQHNPFAMVYGANHTVRLGHNGTNFVIYIGETNSTWNYPQISVRDVILGFRPDYDNWKKDWGISFVTSFSNVSATINNYAWTTKNFTPPTSLPASDVYAWAKEATKPSYTKAEIGLGNVDNTADANKNVNYANSAGSVAWTNVSGRPTSLPASNISMSSDGTTLTITYS